MIERPSREEITQARHAAGLSQSQAAALVHSTLRSWQHWESGSRNMPLAHWELFTLKTQNKLP